MPKKIAAVCIITNAYIPSARVLFDSVRALYPEMPLYALLADVPEETEALGEDVEVIPLEELSHPGIPGMVERYSDFQLCCALKPFAIEEVLRRNRNIDGVMYLDTDLFFLSPLEELEEAAERGYDVILTPHFFSPSGQGQRLDFALVRYGIFNMGFCYFSASPGSQQVLDWWKSRLEYYCYLDTPAGLCDDQKWMDLLPSYSDNYHILRHPGYNVAYWNIDERPVRRMADGNWLAGDAPLRFLHFSHFRMEPEPLFSASTEWYDAQNLYDLPVFVREYAQRLLSAGWKEFRGRPNRLREKLRQKLANIPAALPHLEQPLSKKTRVLSGLALLPLAVAQQAAGAARACREFVANPLLRVKAWGRSFLGPVWADLDTQYRRLEQRGGWRRKTFSPLLLLNMHMRRLSGGVRGLAESVREKGVGGVLDEAARTVFTPPRNRILVTDVRVPHHDMIAADLTTFQILNSLTRLGYSVTFLPWGIDGAERYAQDVRALGVTLDYEPLLHGSPEEYVWRFARNFGIFYLQPLGLAESLLPVIRRENPAAKVIFHAQDLVHIREEREAEVLDDDDLREKARHMKEREFGIFRKVDVVVSISGQERDYIRAEKSVTAPVFNYALLVPDVLPDPPDFTARRDLIFIGIFRHHPNLDGVLWFLENVWPLIRVKEPELKFHVVGNYPPPELLKYDGVEGVIVEGHVPDLMPLLTSCRVAVAPLRYGAGVKGKVALAMSAGLPNVCTSVGAEGMHIENGRQALVADTAEGFAEAVLRLNGNSALWRKISAAGLELAEEKYGERAGREQLKAIFSETGLWCF